MANDILDSNLWNIRQVFENNMFTVPVYQRPYSWKDTHVKTLLDDLFQAYNSSGIPGEEGYFVGSIYLHDRKSKLNGLIPKYDVIDGQQRLTTIAFILLSIYLLFCEKGIETSNPRYTHIKGSLWKYTNSYDKNNRVINLNSIEKQCFADLFDKCFSRPSEILNFIETYTQKSPFDARVIHNFSIVYNRLRNSFLSTKNENIIDFATFILQHVQVISIVYTSSVSKAFTIFESINSKGKVLEEIDNIKTYIFSKLPTEEYEFYLNEWGELTIKTNDNLYAYLSNYIRANIKFYRGDITVTDFKDLCTTERFLEYAGTETLSAALAEFINKLYVDVDYYTMLNDPERAYNLVKNNEFRFYFTLFSRFEYRHPKALFFRCLKEYSSGKLAKDDLIDIVRETVNFMIEYSSISDKSSKSLVTMFSIIMGDIYSRNAIDKSTIINIIAGEAQKRLSIASVKSELENRDFYTERKRKRIGAALLSLYEATNEMDGQIKISYDMAYQLFESYGSILDLDHLLVHRPKSEDENFKYFCDASGHVRFKQGHDFDSTLAGMKYEDFVTKVLNKIGNLRLWYSDKNSSRQNELTDLKEYKEFNTYSQLCDRNKKISDTLVDKCMPLPVYNPDLAQAYSSPKSKFPRMGELIDAGIISVGTKIYLKNAPKISEAILLDKSNVECNGEKMRLTEWGKKFTNWSAIRIYEYIAVVGEEETLQQKRMKYMNKLQKGNIE